MDTREPLASIAKTLPELTGDTLESSLMTFETLVHFGNPEARPEAAGFLRDAAGQCADPSRKERLTRAADALIAGKPLALTPDGQTWQQAAAAQTVGIDEWVEPPEPVYAPEPVEEEEVEEEEDVDDEVAVLGQRAVVEDEAEDSPDEEENDEDEE